MVHGGSQKIFVVLVVVTILVIFLALNVLVVLSFMQFSSSLGFIRRVFLCFLGLFSSYGSHRSPDSFS